MKKEKENCFYYTKWNWSNASRLMELEKEGRIIMRGATYFCDSKSPMTVHVIPKEGKDVTCYGPASSECPGWLSIDAD